MDSKMLCNGVRVLYSDKFGIITAAPAGDMAVEVCFQHPAHGHLVSGFSNNPLIENHSASEYVAKAGIIDFEATCARLLERIDSEQAQTRSCYQVD